MWSLVLLVLFSLCIASIFDDGWKAVLWLILAAFAAVAVFVLLFVLSFLLFGDLRQPSGCSWAAVGQPRSE
jgi:hypothetical protein